MGFDFGREVGGFVKQTLGNIVSSTHTAAPMSFFLWGVIVANMPKTAFSSVRHFATPKQGGFISKTVQKLPKQF